MPENWGLGWQPRERRRTPSQPRTPGRQPAAGAAEAGLCCFEGRCYVRKWTDGHLVGRGKAQHSHCRWGWAPPPQATPIFLPAVSRPAPAELGKGDRGAGQKARGFPLPLCLFPSTLFVLRKGQSWPVKGPLWAADSDSKHGGQGRKPLKEQPSNRPPEDLCVCNLHPIN